MTDTERPGLPTPAYELKLNPDDDVTLTRNATVRGAGDLVRLGGDIIEFTSGAKVRPNGFVLTILEK